MAVILDPVPLPALVELVNGWGSTPRLEAGEQDRPYPARDQLLGQLGVSPDAVPEADAALVIVADQLHPIFATDDRAVRAARINALLALTKVRPALQEQRHHLQASWLIDDSRLALLAAAAVALRDHLADNPKNRLGTCAGRRCADIYVDTSPSGHRRYCSLTCQNRARVAAYRSRHAATS
jgi:predicted RNA-binding Zn ribbon-like protein